MSVTMTVLHGKPSSVGDSTWRKLNETVPEWSTVLPDTITKPVGPPVDPVSFSPSNEPMVSVGKSDECIQCTNAYEIDLSIGASDNLGGPKFLKTGPGVLASFSRGVHVPGSLNPLLGLYPIFDCVTYTVTTWFGVSQ